MTAVVGVAERGGKLRGLVEPKDSEEDLVGGFWVLVSGSVLSV